MLTGETGAGKSILVGALGLAVGQRGDRSLVRSGADRAVVEAQFDLVPGSPAHRWAEQEGLADLLEEGQVIVRRELPASGKRSRPPQRFPLRVGAAARARGDGCSSFTGSMSSRACSRRIGIWR